MTNKNGLPIAPENPTERDLAIITYRAVAILAGKTLVVLLALFAGVVLALPFALGAIWMLTWPTLLIPAVLIPATRTLIQEYTIGTHDETHGKIYDSTHDKT